MSLVFFPLSDWLGRKNSILLLAAPHAVTWIITIYAKTKWEFYISRFIAGTADAILFMSIPPYVGEICTPEVRDFFGNLPTFILYGGQFGITVIGRFFDFFRFFCYYDLNHAKAAKTDFTHLKTV